MCGIWVYKYMYVCVLCCMSVFVCDFYVRDIYTYMRRSIFACMINKCVHVWYIYIFVCGICVCICAHNISHYSIFEHGICGHSAHVSVCRNLLGCLYLCMLFDYVHA